MHKIIKYAIITNLLLAVLFVYSNLTLWELVNSEYPYLISSHWSPSGIGAPHYIINNDSFSIVQTIYMYFNTPFWIFWMLMIVNLYFRLRISTEANEQKKGQ